MPKRNTHAPTMRTRPSNKQRESARRKVTYRVPDTRTGAERQREGVSRRRFLETAGAAAAAAALTPSLATAAFSGCTPQNTAWAANTRAGGGQTLEQRLGATRTALEELLSHENDTYYLGTSYGQTGPGQGGNIANWDSWYPNGKPKQSTGQAYMNCTGFMVAVFEACGANCDTVGAYVGTNGYNRGGKANLSRWMSYLNDNADLRTRYESKEALLASGNLSKGDLIIAEPRNWNASGADNHVMFFWGDSPSEDKAWHSSSHGDGVIAGSSPGNMISKITAKWSSCYWFHVPLTNLIDVTFAKQSSQASFATGAEGAPAYSLAGAAFSVYERYETGTLSGLLTQFTTDAEGKATVQLPPGKRVWVNEDTAPVGFQPWDTPKAVDVPSSNGSLSLDDAPCRVRVALLKQDEETGAVAQGWATLAGATYELQDAKGIEHLASTAWDETRNAWVATFDDIVRGTARLREAQAPKGYTASSLAGADADGWLTLELTPEGGEAIATVQAGPHKEQVIRGDIVGGKYYEPEGAQDAGVKEPLAGARFAIWLQDDGTLAEKGYNVQAITDADGSPVTGASGSALRGYLCGEITSHDDGRFTTHDLFKSWDPANHAGLAAPQHALVYGTYTIVETFCPDPALRLAEPVTDVDVNTDGQEVFFVLEDKRISSPVRVKKIDADTGEAVLIAGTTIELLHSKNGTYETVTFDVHSPADGTISTFIVGESGIVQFPEALPWGDYAIREIAAVAPYTLRGEPVYFSVSEHHDWNESDIIVVELPNKQATGAIVGMKADALDATGVAGATYIATAAADVISPTGTTVLAKGEVAAQATTAQDGSWRMEGLPLGQGSAAYYVQETASPEGYVLDTARHSVTLSWQDDATPVVECELALEEQPTCAEVFKQDANTAAPIAGVEFELATRATEDDEWQEVSCQTTDEAGTVAWRKIDCDASYRIRETKPRFDLGYVTDDREEQRYLSPDGLWFTSKDAYLASIGTRQDGESSDEPSDSTTEGSDVPATEQMQTEQGEATWTVTWENECTRIDFYKIASTDGAAELSDAQAAAAASDTYLKGGTFRLEDAEGNAVQPDDESLDAEGWPAQGSQPVTFTHLHVGEQYAFVELEAPSGYTREREKFAFTVEDTAQAVTVTLANRKKDSMPKTADCIPPLRICATGVAITSAAAAMAAYSRRRTVLEQGSRA